MSSKPSPLQLELAAQIAGLIRSEKLPADAPLREEGLASRLGVSRTPVRAALQLLRRSGHVYYKENAGVFVAPGAHAAPDFRLPRAAGTVDALYRRVLADRGRGALPDTVSEAELLARYKVARALMAKVLLRLNREGLVERRKGHGWTFQPTLATPDAIAESYRFRMMVETAGLLEPAFRADELELLRLREAHAAFAALAPAKRSAADFFAMNLRFHEMLAGFSGNRFVLQAVQQMNRLRKVQEFASFSGESGGLAESCEEHVAILDAVRKGDREWAAALMRRHLAGAAERVMVAGEVAGSVFDASKIQS
jgi:DNA-binding GntR family transcriptional regulator